MRGPIYILHCLNRAYKSIGGREARHPVIAFCIHFLSSGTHEMALFPLPIMKSSTFPRYSKPDYQLDDLPQLPPRSSSCSSNRNLTSLIECLPTTPPLVTLPRIRRRRTTPPPPLSLGSIDEEMDYEGHLNLGAESPGPDSVASFLQNKAFVEQWAAAGVSTPKLPSRRPSWLSLSSYRKDRPTGSKKEIDDRDCGIW